MVEQYVKLADYAATHERCYLIVGSLIPMPKHRRLDWAMKKFQQELTQALSTYEHVKICNYTKYYLTSFPTLHYNYQMHSLRDIWSFHIQKIELG